MTKPIEGWVAWHPTLDSARWQEAKDSLVGITVCMSPEACGDFKDAPDWCARPVRITFTDEVATKEFNEAMSNAWGPGIKEIMEDIKRDTSIEEIRQIIFGEEK